MAKRGFASDNNAGIHPAILKAIESANIGHSIGYGDDEWTKEAIRLFKNEFGEATEVFFVVDRNRRKYSGINVSASFVQFYYLR